VILLLLTSRWQKQKKCDVGFIIHCDDHESH